MAEITIVKGEEFKIAVRGEITKKDLFIEQYKRAAETLDKIVGSSVKGKDKENEKENSWESQDFENNIIAFCGERGEGKSSVMMSFVNAVYKNRNNEIFSNCKNISGTYFAEPILIDPSLFDDVHNILDIVLAKIFRNFYDCYNRDNQCADEQTREKLLDRFQRVYRYVSLINNQKQMLDDEFDYEGNISKLTKLGESTKLKEELVDLIKDYLQFMNKSQGKQQLIIAIDDLDLCSANAYKMAEQIRKYLIIPNVCIVISVKIDQLELCVREKKLEEFKMMYQNRDDEIYAQLNKEVQIMAERYVSKLIPRQRRIYLPKVQRFEDVRIIYKEKDSNDNIMDSWNIRGAEEKENSGEKAELNREDSNRAGCQNRSFAFSMLDLIYERTGMRFWPEEDGSSYLLPNNLRDMISWVLIISEMKKPNDAAGGKSDNIYLENIEKLENYFVGEWAGDSLKSYAGMTLQEIGRMDDFHLHMVVQGTMNKIYRELYPAYISPYPNYQLERPDTFFQVMGYFETINRNEASIGKEAYIYRLRALYTIRIHKLLRNHQYHELTEFLNGYIWGPAFFGLFPAHFDTNIDRSRFFIKTVDSFDLILRGISQLEGARLFTLTRGRYYASQIARTDERNSYLNAWIVLGLFSNIAYNNNNGMYTLSFNGKIISDNNVIWDTIQISLENYLVALCDLDMLYDKINLQKLGVEREEYKEFINVLLEKNQDSIQYARTIVANMDLLVGLREFCFKYRDYRYSTSDGEDRTGKLVFRFLKNIEEYMKQYGIKIEAEKLNHFVLKDNQEIYVSQLYAALFTLSTQNVGLQEQLGKEQEQADLMEKFRKRITDIPKRWSHEEIKASSYLRTQTVGNARINLEKLALGIQRYLGENKKPPEFLDVEGLCELYGNVIKMCFEDENEKLNLDMYNEYKRLVKVQDEMMAGAE